MADTFVQINNENVISVVAQQENLVIASSNLANPANVDTLASVGDVDTSTNGLITGSLLVYKTATNRWTSTTTLEAQDMEGGEF
tara:strand:- start:51340 stop:51591 length:252 start_codon:yes stop_codon:yes gene_type:complete